MFCSEKRYILNGPNYMITHAAYLENTCSSIVVVILLFFLSFNYFCYCLYLEIKICNFDENKYY